MTKDKFMYIECASGISGDMLVAALLDLGADEKKLRTALDSMALPGADIQISRVKKSGIDACDFAVKLDAAHENHDHDMAYLHGTEIMQEHNHDDMHMHNHEHVPHMHRGLAEIKEIIMAADMSERAREFALHVFDLLAEAESEAHGIAKEQVHFHEVGAIDSIIDITAAAVCLDDLDPAAVVISPLTEGSGTVRCAHGRLPVPVPAVVNLVRAHGLLLHQSGVAGELVTPTGAAIAAALLQAPFFATMRQNVCVSGEVATIEAVGIGAGKREYDTAGILRAMWLKKAEASDKAVTSQICKLEANIDDASGEQLGYCMSRLLDAGALDVSFLPLFMKKNRPAYEVHVICEPKDRERMIELLFRETTTIGVRYLEMARAMMKREMDTVETSFGTATVKRCSYGSITKTYPEYESIVQLCQNSGADFREVYQTICVNIARTTE